MEVFTDERTYMPESLIPEVATESDLQRTLIRPIKNRLPHVPVSDQSTFYSFKCSEIHELSTNRTATAIRTATSTRTATTG